MTTTRLVGPLDRPASLPVHSRITAALPLWKGWGYADASHPNGHPEGVPGAWLPPTGFADCIVFTSAVLGCVYGESVWDDKAALHLWPERAADDPWCALRYLERRGWATPVEAPVGGSWFVCQGWRGLRDGQYVRGATGHAFLLYADERGSIMLDSYAGSGPTWRGCRRVGEGAVPTARASAKGWEAVRGWWDEVRLARLEGASTDYR